MIENAARTIVRAISLGVFCRLAPSTRAIILSRKLWPGSAVTRMTIRSERTRVPPVTPEWSPPASRITGALSPVMADSSTEATPSDDLAVGRDHLPGLDRDEVAGAERGRGDGLAVEGVGRVELQGRRVGPGLAEAVGLGLAPGLGQRLGEVGEQDRQQQQERQGRLVDDQAGRRVVDDRLDDDDRGQDPADLDQEHDRVPGHDGRVEHDERPAGRHPDQRRLEQLELPRRPALELEALGVGRRPAGRLDFGIEAHGSGVHRSRVWPRRRA